MISGAAQAMAASLLAAAGRPCVYRRGSEAVELTAYVGATEYETVADQIEILESFSSRDFIFRAADLQIAGVPTVPRRGDQIVEDGHVYEVMSPSAGAPFRYSDPARVLIRVHTKEVS